MGQKAAGKASYIFTSVSLPPILRMNLRWCRSQILTSKRYSVGLIFRTQRFSTISRLATPSIEYSEISDRKVTVLIPETVNIICADHAVVLPQSPDESIKHTTELAVVDPTLNKRWSMFSILDRFGKCLPGALVPSIEKEKMLEMYTVMSRVQALDDVFFNAQRQGRISFYMQSTGEEATQIGKEHSTALSFA